MVENSVLVVNMGKDAVERGLTSPYAVEKFLKNGVRVYTKDNLHAKVVVLGDRAIVGSMNASRNSASVLTEAAIETTEAKAVRACRRFVLSLCGDPVNPDYIQKMKELYRPPKSEVKAKEQHVGISNHGCVWAVRVEHLEYDREDRMAQSRGMPIAESELSSEHRFEIDEFCFTGARFLNSVARADLVLQICSKDGDLELYPPSRVIHVETYVKQDDSIWAIIFLQAECGLKPLNFNRAVWKLKGRGNELRLVKNAKRIVDPVTRHSLLNLLFRQ